MKILTIAGLLEDIRRCGEAVYRGQANAEWRVDCSAARRFDIRPTIEPPTAVPHWLLAYTADLVRGAKQHAACPELRECQSELEILAQLQHHGAATGLIDFTKRPLVALWFACSERPTDDGAVYVLPRSETRVITESEALTRSAPAFFYRGDQVHGKPYLWCPRRVLPGRPTSQASAFVMGVVSLWPKLLWKVMIDKRSKPALLEELRAKHDITEDTLFPDFAGYAHMNSSSKPFNAERLMHFWKERAESFLGESRVRASLDRGIALCELGEYRQAVQCFTDAMSLNAKSVAAHIYRSRAKIQLKDYEGALEDCDTAIELLEGRGGRSAHERIADAYWQKGVTLRRSGQDEQGQFYMRRALEMGVEMYRTPTEEQLLSPYPPSYLNYRTRSP
ncbi:MAG: FRG domain-containing protein [Gammaproteobacteria bacterium]|nr:FRG domain-containing protein [Gammaproteobacteria bacterium]MDE0651610.1 FRG domain-containing protein [Gammaproteobacteria bacterium]